MIDIIGLSKQYGNILAVDNINLKIDRGEFVFLVGPSGAGKSFAIGAFPKTLDKPDKNPRNNDFPLEKKSIM